MAVAIETNKVRRWKRPRETFQTAAEWLGRIPTHWKAVRIKHLCQVKRGASPRPIDDPIYFDSNGEFAWVRISDVTASDRYLESTTERLSELGKSKSVPLLPGRLFLSIAATVGKPIITSIKCCIHDGFVYFDGLKQNQDYWYYVFLSGQAFFGLGKLGTQLNLNTDTIGNILMPVPPLPEQQAIAAFLDRETAKIDALIARKQRLIDLLEEKRRAIISQAVTKGLRPRIKLKPSGVESFGDIPSHWTVLPAKRVSNIFVPERSKPELNYVNDGHPWITTEDIGAEHLDFSRITRFVSEKAIAESGSRLLPANSVIASCVGRFSLSSINPTECVINQQLQAFIPHSIEPSFLRLLIQISEIYFERAATITTLKYVNQVKFADMPVLNVPLTEQKEILESIGLRTSKLNATSVAIERSIERLSEYRVSLISAAVTGQIDIRDEVELDG